MIESMDLIIPYKSLIDRGLNEKASNLAFLIDKTLRAIILDEIKRKYPKERFPEWHFESIKYSGVTEKYFVKIMPGKAVVKG